MRELLMRLLTAKERVASSICKNTCPMFDFGSSPVFIFVPFIAFSIIFLLIILLKSCIVMSRSDMQRGWATQARRSRRTMTTQSTASVEIQTTQHPVPFIPPPGYYSEVMATDSSAMYPMYVPPYAMNSTPPLSMRDPRRFQSAELKRRSSRQSMAQCRSQGTNALSRSRRVNLV
ncbi:hypothetical protein NECAME_04245 [Necator americanus]|uniref:Uncharacterized protein n=1 Tax=Necator americanus TaxID=51031 RepID=W2SYX1_NECAM|nr:hypothetical protein NECAME_04245 [Necator americanus]ETN73852.1 hypothetical protein NECAME_04245 [Necator americanus]